MKPQIIAVLSNHKGKANAITVRQIASQVSTKHYGYSCVPIRQAIREIIKDNQAPIGSCNRGYYLMETEAERMEVINDLYHRIKGIQARMGYLKRCRI